MSGEGESPSALTQWVGKRAQSNRYESWNPDQAVPPQVRKKFTEILMSSSRVNKKGSLE